MALNLQTIVDDAARAGDPADRTGSIKAALSAQDVDRAQVDAILTEAADKFEALNGSDPVDADSLTALEVLSDVVVTARGALTEIDQKADEVRARREELAAQVVGGDVTADTTDVAEAESTGEPAEVEAEAAPVVESAPVAVAASARRIDLSAIRPAAPVAAPAQDSGMTITAAAGVRGVENGASLDLDGLVAATQSRIAGMPRGVDGFVKDGVAQIKVAYPEALVASGNNDQQVLDHAGSQSRIDGGLVASGGWCAPSETLYDLAPSLADPNAGLVDVPDIQVTRGGIRVSEGVSFADVWAGNAGIQMTEAQAIAQTDPKALYRPSCPTPVETRADVVYSGIAIGFLQNDAYPEVTRDAIAGVTAVHAHRVNKLTIDKMVAASTALDLSSTLGPSAAGSVLNGIGLAITDARYRFRAPESLVLDVVLPIWAKEAVRADYALRSGVPMEQVSDQTITGWITARGGRVQWVYDWQDAFSTSPAAGFGGATALTNYPTTVNALVFPSGTFVRGRGSVINLDTVYDSTMTLQNDYLQMFMEEKLLVAKRAYRSLNVKLALGVTGGAGAPQVLANGGTVAPPVTP